MDPALEALIVALRSIRDQADSVLKKIEHPGGERSLAWKCGACGNVKHFTRPAELAQPQLGDADDRHQIDVRVK
jgi:hypothetical protein